MQSYPQMRFGAFIPPFHSNDESPTIALSRDIAMIQLMDELAYDEVWVGEHHSSGFETIGSPELLIAAAAERTKYIRMGTGVSSVTYHRPFILADRMVQLDHQTRGRLMFGVGPGQLPGDAYMLGISPLEQRRMMGESLEVMLALMHGETVTRETDWFRLRDARLQTLPYQYPIPEIAVATAISPNGPSLAGKYGAGMLSLAAGSAAGFAVLNEHWRICEEAAMQHGKVVDRRNWRVVAAVHVADTRAQAFQEVQHGIMDKLEYLKQVGGEKGRAEMNLVDLRSAEEAVRVWTTDDSPTAGLGPLGIGIVGTPADVADRIRKFQERAGGFGCFLMLAHNLASWEATRRSLDLFARKVIPALRGTNRNRVASLAWSAAMADEFFDTRHASQQRAAEEHRAKNKAKSPQ
jgi:limonene 1,2-monooxygenase